MSDCLAQPTTPATERSPSDIGPALARMDVLLDKFEVLWLALGGSNRDSAFYCQQLGIRESEFDDLCYVAIERLNSQIDRERHKQAILRAKLRSGDGLRGWLHDLGIIEMPKVGDPNAEHEKSE